MPTYFLSRKEVSQAKTLALVKEWFCTTVGRNHAPVDMVNISLFTGFLTSQVVQDFFNQQYLTHNLEQKTHLPPSTALTVPGTSKKHSPESSWHAIEPDGWVSKESCHTCGPKWRGFSLLRKKLSETPPVITHDTSKIAIYPTSWYSHVKWWTVKRNLWSWCFKHTSCWSPPPETRHLAWWSPKSHTEFDPLNLESHFKSLKMAIRNPQK